MRLETTVHRNAGERPPPRSLATPVAKPKGRPRLDYEFRVRTEGDVDRLRRRGLPVVLLKSDWVTANGYPEKFRPLLFTHEGFRPRLVESRFRVVPVRDADALRAPGFPEFVTFLLKVDTLAARAVLTRNRGRFDPNEVYRRVRNEGLERLATKVRLQDVVPALPVVGVPLPAEDLAYVERNNPPLALSP